MCYSTISLYIAAKTDSHMVVPLKNILSYSQQNPFLAMLPKQNSSFPRVLFSWCPPFLRNRIYSDFCLLKIHILLIDCTLFSTTCHVLCCFIIYLHNICQVILRIQFDISGQKLLAFLAFIIVFLYSTHSDSTCEWWRKIWHTTG